MKLIEFGTGSLVRYTTREGFNNLFPITFELYPNSSLQVLVGFSIKEEGVDYEVIPNNGNYVVKFKEDLKEGLDVTLRRITKATGVPHTYQYTGNAQGGAEFSAKTIDENFEYTSRIVGEISDYNKVSSDMLEQAFGDASDLVGIAVEARDIASEAKEIAKDVEENAATKQYVDDAIKETPMGDLSEYRKLTNNSFDGHMFLNSFKNDPASVYFKGADGRTLGRVYAGLDNLFLESISDTGAVVRVQLPSKSGTLALDGDVLDLVHSWGNDKNAALSQWFLTQEKIKLEVFLEGLVSKEELNDVLAKVTQGHYSFLTLEEANLHLEELPDNSSVYITNDGEQSGLYTFKEGAFFKSVYDPLLEAKSYTDREVSSLKAVKSLSQGKAFVRSFKDRVKSLDLVDGDGFIIGGTTAVCELASKEGGSGAGSSITAHAVSRKAFVRSFKDRVKSLDLVDKEGFVIGGTYQPVKGGSNGGNDGTLKLPQTLYMDAFGIKSRGASTFQVLATIVGLPYKYIDPPFWWNNGKGIVTGIDRATISNQTSALIIPRGNGFVGSEMVIPSGEDLLIVIPMFGQSNSVGAQAYTPDEIMTENKWGDRLLMPAGVDGKFMDVRLNMPSGQESAGSETVLDPASIADFKPLVSIQSEKVASQGSTPLEGMAYGLANALEKEVGYVPRMLVFTAGWGGRYQSQLAKGTIPYNNLMTAMLRIKELADRKGLKVWCPAVAIVHGESDSSRTSYLTSIRDWQKDIQEDIKVITRQSGGVPFFTTQASTFKGSNTNGVLAPFQFSKAEPSNCYMATPYYPYPLVNDLLHLGKSCVKVGEKLGHSIARSIGGFGIQEDGVLSPNSAVMKGSNEVVVGFNVPKLPLVLDTTDEVVNSVAVKDYGFTVKDSNDTILNISSVTIKGSEVTIKTTEPLAVGFKVEYGLNGFGETKVRGEHPRGCLRDSDNLKFYVDGTPAYNWCVHFSLEIKEEL